MFRRCAYRRVIGVTLSAAGLMLGVLAASPARAQNQYFDVNGATAGYGIVSGSTYSWDDNNWANATGGGNPTGAWVQGSFPRFQGGVSGNSYTVTVANDEQMPGMFQTVNGVSLTINAIGAGKLDIATGLQGIINGGSAAVLTINAPITGPGQIQPSNGGNIFLNGVNTYSGGTSLSSSATLIHFNNGSSFGTGTITNNITTVGNFAPLLGSGGAPITLPNNFAMGATSGVGFNFAADNNTPIISTGTWSLGARNVNLRNNGNATSPLSLTNTISGTGGVTLSGANGGTINLSGANTYTGATTLGVTGARNITLKLGAANTLASTVSLILGGGTLNPGGFNHSMTGTTLGLTANSVIDFGAGASLLSFADSSALNWTGTTLNLVNWNPAVDALRFGTNGTALTAVQLAKIEFNGTGLGTARLDVNGFVVVASPEPGALALLGLGVCAAFGVLRGRRKRTQCGAV